MKDTKILLAQRLAELQCDRVPAWLQARLLPLIEAEAEAVAAKAEQQLQRRISRVITVKTVGAAFIAGAPAQTGEGPEGEAAPLLRPTVNGPK